MTERGARGEGTGDSASFPSPFQGEGPGVRVLHLCSTLLNPEWLSGLRAGLCSVYTDVRQHMR